MTRRGSDLELEDGRRLGVHPARDPRLDERARPAREVVEGGHPHPPGHRRQRRRLPHGQARTRARAQTLGCQRGGVRRARPRWRAATGKEVRRTPRVKP